MFYMLLMLCCAHSETQQAAAVKQKEILLNVQKSPDIEKLQFFKEEVHKIRLTNESRIRFVHEQAEND